MGTQKNKPVRLGSPRGCGLKEESSSWEAVAWQGS